MPKLIVAPLFGSFVRPSVMRRASCMGSQMWQILLFIPPSHFPSHFSPLNSHFSPFTSLSPLTFHPSTHFPLSLFTLQLTFPSHFSPLPSHFTLSLSPFNSHFTSHFHPSTLTFPSHFSPLNSHFCSIMLHVNYKIAVIVNFQVLTIAKMDTKVKNQVLTNNLHCSVDPKCKYLQAKQSFQTFGT